MEFIAAKKDLLKVASRMLGVVERKSTMPVLVNVLLTTVGDGVQVAGTDLYLGLTTSVPATVKQHGSIALPAKELVERLKAMPDGQISVALKGALAILKAAGSARRFSLRVLPGADFPPLPQPAEDAPSLSVRPSVLLELIAKASYAISADETRPHLNALLIEWDRKVLRAVATDGHRLSKVDVAVDAVASTSFLLPLKAVHELRRLCEDVQDDAPITISQTGPTVFFQAGETFSAKAVDATFPPYLQVIPKAWKSVVRIPRVPFAEALRAVSVASNERVGGVKLVFAPGLLSIHAETVERGAAADELPIEGDTTLTIGFCAKYFLDVMGALACPEVEVRLCGELDSAVIVDPSPAAGHDFLAVVMPMRV